MFTPTLFWYVAEANLSIVFISLPAIFHLFRRAHEHGLRSILKREDVVQSHSHRLPNTWKSGDFQRFDEEISIHDALEGNKRGGASNLARASKLSTDDLDIPLESIYMRRDVQVDVEGQASKAS